MTRPGFSIYIGPDSSLIKDQIEQDLANATTPKMAWSKSVFWGEEPLPAEFWEQITLQGLFSRPVAVILRHAENLAADTLKKLSAALATGSGQTWPFICLEAPFEKGRPKLPAHLTRLKFYEFARQNGWAKDVPPLEHRGIRSFAAAEAKKLGLRLTPEDIGRIAPALPPDAGAIRLEMGKLALAAIDGKLPPNALELLNFEQEMDVFALLQALQGARSPMEVWSSCLKDGENTGDAGLFAFLWALARETRVLWQLLAGEQVFLPGHVIAGKTAFARALGYGGLGRMFEAALAADKGVKTGERNPQQAFEILIADLFRLFRPGPGRE